MSDTQSHTNIIAKNSIYMSIRMVFIIAISLYTTRVIFEILGIEDYGVYNVVCGFVSMFAFLNTSISNGIQRFYNFEFGKNGVSGAIKVYNTSLLIQLFLSVIIILLTESVGLWYLHNKMVIPDGRVYAAEWVFQCSIISFILIILQSPYTAAVMAHERLDFYALVSVFDVALKLGIVLVLPYFQQDKLIVYGILFMLISLSDFVLYYVYCKKHFCEIKIKFNFDKDYFCSMLKFSGWNIFGSLCGVMKEQGINLVLNSFFGTVVNAARGVAAQINGGLQNLVSNISIPVRPQVIQSYARGEFERTLRLTYSVSKLSCCFLYLCAYPIALEVDFILRAWLGNTIPEHTNTFVILIIMTTFVNNLNSAISGVIHASGRMMVYQLVTSAISIMCVPFAYIGLRYGLMPEFALIMVFVWSTLSQVASLFILKQVIKFSIKVYLKKVLLPFMNTVVLSFWPPLLIHMLIEEGIGRFFLVGVSSVVISSLCIFYIALDEPEKSVLKNFVGKRIIKNKRN